MRIEELEREKDRLLAIIEMLQEISGTLRGRNAPTAAAVVSPGSYAWWRARGLARRGTT